MAFTDYTEVGQAPSTPLPTSTTSALQTNRGWTNAGLRSRPIGRYTYQITGGTANAANTYDVTANGVSLTGGSPVVCTATPNTDAASLATAINAYSATSGWYATVSTNTVTIRQRRSGAATIAKVVTGNATATLVAAFASSDTWTEVVSGAAFDGDEYYELSWSGALVVDTPGGVDLTNARATYIRAKVTGQAFELWSGKGVQTSSNVILAGCPTDADTWTNDLPWFNASLPLTIKVAADAVLVYEVLYV